MQRGINRMAIGVGMIPRGEVGLIFAGIGATLILPNEAGQMDPVIGPATFGAVVIMVIATTLVTPPALKWPSTGNRRRSLGVQKSRSLGVGSRESGVRSRESGVGVWICRSLQDSKT